MAKILKEVDFIGKNKTTTGGSIFKFRGIDDMYNTLHKSFADNGVFLIPEVLEATVETQEKADKKLQYSSVVKVKFTCFAEDGSSISGIGVGHALDTSDKGTNKAQSSALKYFLMQTFLIPTEEDKDVENSNLEASKTKNQTKSSNQKPPAEPPKTNPPKITPPVKTPEEDLATGIIYKLKNNITLDLEKATLYLLTNEAKIPTNLVKEATDLINQKRKQVVNIEANPDEITDEVLASFDPNYVN